MDTEIENASTFLRQQFVFRQNYVFRKLGISFVCMTPDLQLNYGHVVSAKHDRLVVMDKFAAIMVLWLFIYYSYRLLR
jgi:hypothetical protein